MNEDWLRCRASDHSSGLTHHLFEKHRDDATAGDGRAGRRRHRGRSHWRLCSRKRRHRRWGGQRRWAGQRSGRRRTGGGARHSSRTGRWALLSLQFRQHDEFVDVAELTIEHVGGAGHHAGDRRHAGLLVLLAFTGEAEDLAEFAEAEAGEHAGGEGGIGVAGTGGR